MDEKTFDQYFGHIFVQIRFAKNIKYYPYRTAQHKKYLVSMPRKESLEELLVKRANEFITDENEKAKVGDDFTLYEISLNEGFSFTLSIQNEEIQLGLGVWESRW